MNALFPMENVTARCVTCGRKLTDPDSIGAGQGPVCRHGKEVMRQETMRFAPLTERHTKVLGALLGHRGKAQAIPTAALVKTTGIPERQVRELIRDLVEEQGELIGSCKEGFFRIDTDEEARECRRAFLVTARAALARATTFGASKRLRHVLNQLQKELEENP